MRFLEPECLCGFNLATAEPKEVLYIGKGKDKVPYGECPACGRDYLLTEGEAATTPVAAEEKVAEAEAEVTEPPAAQIEPEAAVPAAEPEAAVPAAEPEPAVSEPAEEN